MKHLIEKYKGVDIYYETEDGYLEFNFEGNGKEVKYLFEAKKVIDEPVWEDCYLEGYFIDGVFGDYIGKARAVKKDKKSGKPYWELQGEYDMGYKHKTDSWRELIVYPKNKETDIIYNNWKIQKDKVSEEKRNLQYIIGNLKK